MKLLVSFIFLACIFKVGHTQPTLDLSGLFTVDELSRKVILVQQPPELNSQGASGSSFLIKNQNRYVLVTARHVASVMKTSSQLVFPTSNSTSTIVDIIRLNPSNKWLHHPIADISVLELFPPNNKIKLMLDSAAFPIINITKGLFEIGTEVIMLGYPILDVIGKRFSPLFFDTKIASKLLTQPCLVGNDKNLCDVFFLQSPSYQGLSGGPVIVGVNRTGIGVTDKTYVIGVTSATMIDNTGGKAAKIIPMVYLEELLVKLF